MLEAGWCRDGMNAEYEHQYSGNFESLTTLVFELMVAFVFVTETDDMWSELQVANPNTTSPAHLPTGLTYISILWNMNE